MELELTTPRINKYMLLQLSQSTVLDIVTYNMFTVEKY